MTTIHATPPGADPFSSSPIHSSSYPDLASLESSIHYSNATNSKSSYIHAEYDSTSAASAPSSAPSSPQLTHASFSHATSYASTPASSISLDTRGHVEVDEEDDDMLFPSYDISSLKERVPYNPQAETIDEEPSQLSSPVTDDTPVLPGKVNDDQAVETEPTRHVDYLSHEWREEDIWSSWSYIVHRRKKITNSVRLENASWRTWMKAKNHLKTISPETLNWLKDCDVTWLYGPLQTETRKSLTTNTSPPPSRLSHSSSFLAKKPILKKKSASAAILERSRSQHSLLQRASEIIRVQQSSPAHGRPVFRRGNSDFTLPRYTGSSVANTPAEHDVPGFTGTRSSFAFPDPPTPADCKHVLFNEEVRQVQAVDSEDDEKEEVDEAVYDTDEDDDGGLMMAPSRSRGSKSGTPRGSFGGDGKTIMPLPSTTLKYRTDTPEPLPQQAQPAGLWPHGRKLSPSPSQETLRPPRPSHNFLIDDDPEVSDEPWQPRVLEPDSSPYEEDAEPGPSMRRTESGMFMPYDENEEEAAMNNTLFGNALYAVNTFKDIAHVVWNVGWHRK